MTAICAVGDNTSSSVFTIAMVHGLPAGKQVSTHHIARYISTHCGHGVVGDNTSNGVKVK